MIPYYSDGLVTIYHANCRDVLPAMPRGCAVVTDQPYGTGWARGGGAVGEFHAVHSQSAWDVWNLDWATLVPAPRAFAVFGPLSRRDDLRNGLRSPNGIVWWQKTNPRPLGPDREAICIWPSYLPEGIEFSAYNGDTPLHPNQKPLALMLWVLGFMPSDAVVLDPFAGSGTTLFAAKQLGRSAIGIEAEERYCEVAAERCRQEVLDFTGAV